MLLSEIYTYSTVADDRSCSLHCLSFGTSCSIAPVDLSTRYTTADIVLEIGSTSVTAELWQIV